MMLSSHLCLCLPLVLVVKGFLFNTFLAALVSGILCTWPNQLSLWAILSFSLSKFFLLFCSAPLFIPLCLFQYLFLFVSLVILSPSLPFFSVFLFLVSYFFLPFFRHSFIFLPFFISPFTSPFLFLYLFVSFFFLLSLYIMCSLSHCHSLFTALS